MYYVFGNASDLQKQSNENDDDDDDDVDKTMPSNKTELLKRPFNDRSANWMTASHI